MAVSNYISHTCTYMVHIVCVFTLSIKEWLADYLTKEVVCCVCGDADRKSRMDGSY